MTEPIHAQGRLAIKSLLTQMDAMKQNVKWGGKLDKTHLKSYRQPITDDFTNTENELHALLSSQARKNYSRPNQVQTESNLHRQSLSFKVLTLQDLHIQETSHSSMEWIKVLWCTKLFNV